MDVTKRGAATSDALVLFGVTGDLAPANTRRSVPSDS